MNIHAQIHKKYIQPNYHPSLANPLNPLKQI